MADESDQKKLKEEIKAAKKELSKVTSDSIKAIKDLQKQHTESIKKLTDAQEKFHESLIKAIYSSVDTVSKKTSKLGQKKSKSGGSATDSEYREYLEEEAKNAQEMMEKVADSQAKYSRTLYERVEKLYAERLKELNDIFKTEQQYYADEAALEKIQRERNTQSVINSMVAETKSRQAHEKELKIRQDDMARLLDERDRQMRELQRIEDEYAKEQKDIQDRNVAAVIQAMVDETKVRDAHTKELEKRAREYEQLLLEQERVQKEYIDALKRHMAEEQRTQDMLIQSEINKMIEKTKQEQRKEKELQERMEATKRLYDEKERNEREWEKYLKDEADKVRREQERLTQAIIDKMIAETKAREQYQKDLEKLFNAQKEAEESRIKEMENRAREAEAESMKLRMSSLNAMDMLVSITIKITTAFRNLFNNIREIQQQLGVNAGVAAGVKGGNIFESFKSFFSSGAFVNQQQIQTARTDFQTEFGGVLTAEAAATIARRGVEEGITASQQATARRVFMTQTGGNVAGARTGEKQFISAFEQSSLTSKDAMEAIGKYSELLARNGVRFSQSFTKAAADAKKIGVDLNKVDQVGDNIIGNFEGFLESQAELGAMGFNFDSFRLTQIAETGDTGALFNELRSQLQGMGKDIGNLRRSEQLAISEAYGISMSELQRMAGDTSGSGEQTIQDLSKESNSLLTKIVDYGEKASIVFETIAKALGLANTLLYGIFRNTGGFSKIISDIKNFPKVAKEGIQKIKTPSVPSGNASGGMMSRLGKAAPSIGKIGGRVLAGLGGAFSGYGEYQKSGSLLKALVRGGLVTAGGMLGGYLGGSLGSVVGPAGTVAGGIGGSLAGSYGAEKLTDYLFSLSDDMTAKAGYGERTLVTPTATVALNNDDNIIAYADDMMASSTGITKYAKGELAPTPQINNQVDLSKLEAKMDQLVRTMSNMNVYIDSTKVGKILTNNNDVGTKVGIMGIQQTTAL